MKLTACFSLAASLAVAAVPAAAQTRVGPNKGTVIVVGGGSVGQEILGKFIEAAGGPDALIIDVPTAGGAATYPSETAVSRSLKAAGARNVVVLHTVDRTVADADSFVAPIRKAGGVWFEGGRQWHLVDSYAGTKSETEFRNVLDRGGVVAGSSAGASILSSFLLRGAREGNEAVVAPQYLVGFGYLKDVAIDQHVVARSRLRDLADSLLPRYPNLLGISEDEGTAWHVRGDSAEIIGRNKAFVYGGKENDPGRPFLTLRPGDRYDLANRRVISRASDKSPLSTSFVDDVFRKAIGTSMATVIVASGGKVLVNKSYNVPEDSVGQGAARKATYLPTTTTPQFDVGNIALPLYSVAVQAIAREGKLSLDDVIPGSSITIRDFLAGKGTIDDGKRLGEVIMTKGRGRGNATAVDTRLYTPIGMHRTLMVEGKFMSDVDELYRFEFGQESSGMFLSDSAKARGGAPELDPSLGWIVDNFAGKKRISQYGTPAGKRAAFMRFPDDKTTIVILTDSDNVNAKAIAESLASRLYGGKR